MFTVNKNPTADDLRKFGWAMLIGFGVIGVLLWIAQWYAARDLGLLHWAGSGQQIAALCLWAAGIVLCAVSLASPAVAKPVYVVWMSIAVPIGIVVSTILLSILFFLFLPLFSLVVRLGDPLRKKLHTGETYWEDYKPHEATLERVKRPF